MMKRIVFISGGEESKVVVRVTHEMICVQSLSRSVSTSRCVRVLRAPPLEAIPGDFPTLDISGGSRAVVTIKREPEVYN